MHQLVSALLLVALFAAVPSDAGAQNARQARAEIEASMLVTGHVEIDRDGRVSAFAVDHADKLPAPVVRVVYRALPGFRFEPVQVDGAADTARAAMSLRLVASPAGEHEMRVRIASAHFGEERARDDASQLRADNLLPPRYPQNIAQMGGKGTVYLLVQVGRDGRPLDVVAEQVNLTAVGNSHQMARIRTGLSRAAIEHARKHWTFIPPSQGEYVDRDYWVSRVPVAFMLDRDVEPGYGEWHAYHPGERTRPSWAAPMPEGFSPDVLIAGGATPEQSRFRLLSGLDG